LSTYYEISAPSSEREQGKYGAASGILKRKMKYFLERILFSTHADEDFFHYFGVYD
jgi:hypothetical protein